MPGSRPARRPRVPASRRGLDHDGCGCAALDGGFREAMDMRVLPVEARPLGGRKLDAVGKCASWIDQRLYDVITTTRRARVGAVIVDVHRTAGGGIMLMTLFTLSPFRAISVLSPQFGGIDEFGCHSHARLSRHGGCIVGYGDIKGIAGIDVQSRVLEAVRRHETEFLPAESVDEGGTGRSDKRN
jgi:hypothetical protein